MNKPGHFWCSGCGCDRPYSESVNEIIDGEALCYRCNQQLEVEPGRGAPEKPLDTAHPKQGDCHQHTTHERTHSNLGEKGMKYKDYKGTDTQYMIELLQKELADSKQYNGSLVDRLEDLAEIVGRGDTEFALKFIGDLISDAEG